MSESVRQIRIDAVAVTLTAAALTGALLLNLLPALFAGLLVHALVHTLAPRLFGQSADLKRARFLVVMLLTVLVIVLATLLVAGSLAFLRNEGGNLSALLQRMAEIVENARNTMPAWLQDNLPADANAIRDAVAEWLREHAAEVRKAGGEAGRGVIHAVIGMVIGALVAVREIASTRTAGPLSIALKHSFSLVADSFRRIVLAQVQISAFNTLLTAIFLFGVLPLCDIHLPLRKTMIAVTFAAGLLPIIGNLVSNFVIVVISLSYSAPVAAASLVFLIAVHKLEYFINARIVGSRINAAAWELLIAMLVIEAAFGLAGVIAAPVYYAYIKAELVERRLI